MPKHVDALPAPRHAAPLSSHSIILASHDIQRSIATLRSRGVLVSTTERRFAASPLQVGQEPEAQLRLLSHSLRVTKHLPEAFFVFFDNPVHRDRVVLHGRIMVEGTSFRLRGWRETEHAVTQTYNLHVRICIEKMPLHLWCIEGAKEVLGKDVLIDRLDSHTYAQDDTVMFSCWVWAWSLDRIPSRHGFSVFSEGTGRVEEMNGFSPPSSEVAPPPEGTRYDALIHIDLVEDWTVHEVRTPSSGQSGIPSSPSDEERPYPMVQPYTWRLEVEDGDGPRHQAPPSSRDGLQFFRRSDDDEGESSRQRRGSWRDALLAPSRGRGASRRPTAAGLGGTRHRSRTPAGHRRATSLPSSGQDIA